MRLAATGPGRACPATMTRSGKFAYGPDSKIGTFSDGLMSQAENSGWTVISMKDDRQRIFAIEE